MKTIKIFAVSLPLLLIVGCAGKPAKWESVNNSNKIICKVSENESGQAFISRLYPTKYRTTLAPESILSVDAKANDKETFYVRKRLRRYIPSLSGYSTLSELEILISFKKNGGSLIFTPLKKRTSQASLVGEWPIPEMKIQELASYFGGSCVLKS